MLSLQSLPVRTAAFGVGVAAHQLFFKKGEWDLWAPSVIGAFLAAQSALVAYLHLWSGSDAIPLREALRIVWLLGCCVTAGTALSILTYRAFFHRLNRFPGPYGARLSNWYVTLLAAKRLHLYEEVEGLHAKYGDFVRLGPQELSVNHPKAIAAINSAQSPCTKGPWYNATKPRVSLQMIRDKKEHAKARKVWDKAFGSKALRDYEPRVKSHTDLLLSKIDAGVGKPMNMSDWFNFYSFDIMGDLAFGKSFGMLRDGVKKYFMEVTHEDMLALGYLGHLIWLLPFIKMTPGLNAASLAFWKWMGKTVDERIANRPETPDVFSHVLDAYEAAPKTKQSRLNLEEDAHLIVVAGSDTTAASLTCLFWHLAQDPKQTQAIREEVDQYFTENTLADSNTLSKLKHLDAVINESLRLHPPVPSGVQRLTPPEGITVGETFIPGNTIVQIPMHTQFRDPRNFVKPNEFIPERWTTKPELVLEPGNSIPFSVGPYSCVGKQLALMEMRYVVSQIVHRYDVSLAQGQSAQKFLDDKKDAFTLALGELNLVFDKRKSS